MSRPLGMSVFWGSRQTLPCRFGQQVSGNGTASIVVEGVVSCTPLPKDRAVMFPKSITLRYNVPLQMLYLEDKSLPRSDTLLCPIVEYRGRFHGNFH